MLRVQVLIHVHGGGLRRNLRVWQRLLRAAGCAVTVTAFQPTTRQRVWRGIRKTIPRLIRRPLFDINIFDETIGPDWLHTGRVNCLSPHQEWFPDAQRELLPHLDWVLCKTHFAETVFRELGCHTQFTGFTTDDRYDPGITPDYSKFLHVAGSSTQKGTAAIDAVWARHPEWPTLKVYWHEPGARMAGTGNVEWIRAYAAESDIVLDQNKRGVHLCPSEAEGFGHYLAEAMSCRALVVTTDAPPMNELVTPERGVLARYHRTALQGAGTNYYVDPDDLERQVNLILSMDETRRRELGQRAREWFLENDRDAPTRLKHVFEAIS